MTRNLILPSALVFALGAAIVATPGKPQGAMRLAATVNGEQIRAGEVAWALAQSAPERGRVAAEALERIIDQELLAQAARKAGLDRDPGVVQAVEAARRRILGEAWLERAAARDGNRAEIGKFYQDHPELFSERRVYRVLEIAAIAPQEMLGEIARAAERAANVTDVAAWLESRGLAFNVSTASRPAEQIPLDILPSVAGMREGQMSVFPTARGVSIVQLLRAAAVPMTEREAAPLIARYLANRRHAELAVGEARKLRAGAAIEYFGEFQAPRGGAGSRARQVRAEWTAEARPN